MGKKKDSCFIIPKQRNRESFDKGLRGERNYLNYGLLSHISLTIIK